MNGRELADHLGLNPKWLRELIRAHQLGPTTHVPGRPYDLDAADVARISRHPAVAQAIANARER